MYGVLDILRDKYHPIPLKRSEVYSLIESIGVEKRLEKEIDFVIGETIEVTSGPFSNFQGKVEQINESKQTVRVVINIFGRVTPLELDVLQVKKIEN
jgi:transcriptional antiterminator NusG